MCVFLLTVYFSIHSFSFSRESKIFSRLANNRIEYYRQLQRISDSVLPPVFTRDLDIEHEILSIEERDANSKIAQLQGRKRYLEHLISRQEGASIEDRECGICRSDFEIGIMTQCGHLFCEGADYYIDCFHSKSLFGQY